MKIAVFSSQKFEKQSLLNSNKEGHEITFFENRLNLRTCALANGFDAVILFVNDDASKLVLDELYKSGIRHIALRCAGFNNVDIAHANQLGIKVANVPAYSPYAVAEHAIALIMSLNRRIIRAHNRVSELNFSLDGLTGFDMHGKTVGVIGTGKIGEKIVKILNGFGCKVLAYDIQENTQAIAYGATYTDFNTICKESDIITLHAPLNDQTKHMINHDKIALMKDGVMIINTSRGALINTLDVIKGLKSRKIAYLGIDVYEEEQDIFFVDHSDGILQDDVIARLMTFPNVLITAHQAFLTHTALKNIADTTFDNLNAFDQGKESPNVIKL